MQPSHLIGAAALIAAVGLWTGSADEGAAPHSQPSSESQPSLETQPSAETRPLAEPQAPPVTPPANGHFVLVVEGDRNGLDVTFASKKADPWAGVPKAFDSNWRLSVADAQGVELVNLPLDVRPFATSSRSVGKPVQVLGCIVVDAKIGMLVNVPCFPTAASYRFLRIERDKTETTLGTVAAPTINQLATGAKQAGEPR